MEHNETQEEPKTIRISSAMDCDLHRRLKAYAILQGQTGYGEILQDAVREYLDRREAKQ